MKTLIPRPYELHGFEFALLLINALTKAGYLERDRRGWYLTDDFSRLRASDLEEILYDYLDTYE